MALGNRVASAFYLCLAVQSDASLQPHPIARPLSLPPALLKAIGEKRVAAIPQNLRILLMGQTIGEGEAVLPHVRDNEETVLQHVIRSDKQRERAVREAGRESVTTMPTLTGLYLYILSVLSAALENAADPLAASRTLRRLKHERKRRELDQANKIAAYRSGARGKKARKEQIALEEELVAATAAYVVTRMYLFIYHPLPILSFLIQA